MNIIKRIIHAIQFPRSWQMRVLENTITTDMRWMAHDSIAYELTRRYLSILKPDWEKTQIEEVFNLRLRIGLDPWMGASGGIDKQLTEDILAGILYSNSTNASEDGKWIEEREYRKLAKIIHTQIKVTESRELETLRSECKRLEYENRLAIESFARYHRDASAQVRAMSEHLKVMEQSHEDILVLLKGVGHE